MKNQGLSISGNQPVDGWVKVEKGQVTDYSLKFDEYIVNYDETTKEIVTIKNGELEKSSAIYYGTKAIEVYFNPNENGGKCTKQEYENNSNNLGNSGCMRWYAYSEDENGVNMILDHNTSTNLAWDENGDVLAGPSEVFLTQLYNDTSDWNLVSGRSDYYSLDLVDTQNYVINYADLLESTSDKEVSKARLISAEEIAAITGANKSIEDGGIDWKITNTNKSEYQFYFGRSSWVVPDIGMDAGTNPYGWLYDNTVACQDYGCNMELAGEFNRYSGYWTSSAVQGHQVIIWTVESAEQLSSCHERICSTNYGIRPVITVPKNIVFE